MEDNNSAITLHNIGLFTRYSFEEGFKEGLKEGYKKGLKEWLEKELKGKMDTDEMETFIETVLNTVEREVSAEDIANSVMKEDKNDSGDNILRTNKLTPEEMEAYNNSAITQHNIGLFTESARKEGLEEGFKEGLKKGYKKGLKEWLEKELKGKMDTDEMETFIETILNTVERDFSAEDIANLMDISIEQEVNDILEKWEQRTQNK